MADILKSVWFRVGLFVAILLMFGLKFWLSRRKYLREEAERLAERNYSIRSREGQDESIVRVDSTSPSYNPNHVGRNLSPLPPPEFDDAIKYCEKVDIDIAMEDESDEPPPSYSEYVRTVSAGEADVHSQMMDCAIPIPSVHGQLQKEYDKAPSQSAAPTHDSTTKLPDAENHL